MSWWSGATPERTSPNGVGSLSMMSTCACSPNFFSSCTHIACCQPWTPLYFLPGSTCRKHAVSYHPCNWYSHMHVVVYCCDRSDRDHNIWQRMDVMAGITKLAV